MTRATCLLRLLRLATAALLVTITCLIAAAAPAQQLPLPEVVGLHVISHHFDDGKRHQYDLGWNNKNRGLYARWRNGFTLGGFQNSQYRDSYYFAWTFTDAVDRFGLTLGVISGYYKLEGYGSANDDTVLVCEQTSVCFWKLRKPVLLPLVAPSVRFPITERLSARLSLMPGRSRQLTAHLSIEGRF